MVSRVERTPFAAWWWTVDRLLLAALLALMLTGIILSLAASPPVAARLGLDPFYFVHRHVVFLMPALVVMLATSFLPRAVHPAARARGLRGEPCVGSCDVGLRPRGQGRAALDRDPRRQPAAVGIPQAGIRDPGRLAVWRDRARARRCRPTPSRWRCLALRSPALVLQPDFGQTMLVALVWGALFFMAGMRMIWVIGLGGAAGAGHRGRLFHGAACRPPHPALPRSRFGRHLQDRHGAGIVLARRLVRPRPGRGHGQAHPAREPYRLRLRGRGRGIRHRALPRFWSRLFAFIVLRALSRAMHDEDPFTRFAVAGPRDPVRTPVGDQHGGQPASDAGQGHDAAVHFLWRLVDDLAGLRHGHAARAHTRTTACAVAGEPRRAGAGSRARRDAAGRRAARPAGGRRYRRPSVSGRSAGGGAGRAAAPRRSRDRPPRRALRHEISRAPDSCDQQRDCARPRSDLARRAPRRRSGSAACRPGGCSAGCSRPRWSASAAIRRCRRCWRRRCAASRRSSTSRTP